MAEDESIVGPYLMPQRSKREESLNYNIKYKITYKIAREYTIIFSNGTGKYTSPIIYLLTLKK